LNIALDQPARERRELLRRKTEESHPPVTSPLSLVAFGYFHVAIAVLIVV
jgi:hypothetical protein